ncbi:MAG: hypothetical protein ACI9N9_002617, partial [Enterobacterales bacterium]
WFGSVPNENDAITIPEGVTLTLDSSQIVVGNITVNGILIFGAQDISLTTDWIMVSGELRIGTASAPYTHQASITLTGDPSQSTMGHGSRGIFIMNGTLELHGVAPGTAWTQISQHAAAGATQLTVLENAGWQSGDQIVIAPTDYYGVSSSQLLTLNAVNNNVVSVTQPVDSFRWGLLQYATSTGMSLTDDSSIIPPAVDAPTPLVLDERAEVGNLTRNIKIQSINDPLWQNEGFGAQVIVMGLNSVIHVDGVEFQRSGQAGLLGHYPFHWHKLSYAPDGTELGDVDGHYVQNSSIHNSANRCVTIHATNGVLFKNNICYDIQGHGIFFEDAVERRNVIDGNLVLGVRNQTNENALLLNETQSGGGPVSGASGAWITNPDNTVVNNVFADSEGFGLWMAFPDHTLGASKNVAMQPNRLIFGNFDYNKVHSNKKHGVMFDNPQINDEGRVAAVQYASASEQEDPNCNHIGMQRLSITGLHLSKNGGNYWNRVSCASYFDFVSADSAGKFFAGSGTGGLITRALMVGRSLNNYSESPDKWSLGPATAFATYHSTFKMVENVLINFPLVEGDTSGAFASDDYYLRPVEKGTVFNRDNLMINTHPGHRSDALADEGHLDNFARGYTTYKFAGAVWDPYGLWGQNNSWNVYDTPFFTHNATCTTIEPASENASSCEGNYFGVSGFVVDQSAAPWSASMEIDVNRLDENNIDTVVGNWQIDASQEGNLLYNMRHFSAFQDGIYQLDFPDRAIPKDVFFEVDNVHNAGDAFIVAVRFDGSLAARVYSTTWSYPEFLSDGHASGGNNAIKHDYNGLSSLDELKNSNGETYWQDTNNNLVWIKVSEGGIEQFLETEETPLYNRFTVRIW